MKKEKIGLRYKKKKIEFSIRRVSGLGFALGLMFSRREKASALLFEFKKKTNLKIHSLFVWFPFIAIWLNEKNEIIKKEIVKPWRISISLSIEFKKLIEIPLNKKYSKITKFLCS